MAPGISGLRRVRIDFLRVKCLEIHLDPSCFDFPCQGNQFLQSFLLQLQQLCLLCQYFLPVKVRAVQDRPDVPKRKLQFPEQQDLLQPLQCCLVVQAVTRLGAACGRQQTDPVVVLQRPDGNAGQLADLVDGHHKPHLLSALYYKL